jgi:hypothetical protein
MGTVGTPHNVSQAHFFCFSYILLTGLHSALLYTAVFDHLSPFSTTYKHFYKIIIREFGPTLFCTWLLSNMVRTYLIILKVVLSVCHIWSLEKFNEMLHNFRHLVFETTLQVCFRLFTIVCHVNYVFLKFTICFKSCFFPFLFESS